MKEKILEALKTKYSNLGLSKDVLNGYADYLTSSITEEEGIEDGVAKIEGLLKIQQKEYDKIRAIKKKAEEVKAPIAEEPTDKKEPEKKIEQKTEKSEKKVVEEIPEWAKILLGKVEQLEKRNADYDKATKIETRRKDISNIVGKLPTSLKKAYERMNLDIADDEFETLKTSITEEVGELEKEISQKNAITKPPLAKNSDGSKQMISKEKANAYAKRLLNH